MTGVIVHEWLARAGGSENVVEAMLEALPEADLVCLWDDSKRRFDRWQPRETWLAKTPFRHSKSLAMPLMPVAWRTLGKRDYDWALVSSHLFAHQATFSGKSPDFRKLVYVHTPARYLWTPEYDARGRSLPVRVASRPFKALDRSVGRKHRELAANSEFVKRRIVDCWEVESRVIYPPVNVQRIQSESDWRTRLDGAELEQLEQLPSEFLLGASRFVDYKRLHEVIAAGEASRLPVVIAGSGPLEFELRQRAIEASIPVHFVIAPSTPMLYALFQAAMVFIFPPVEDFGIIPVEAMACGTPVVVNRQGGASESAHAPMGGRLADFEGSARELERAVTGACGADSNVVMKIAQRFDVSRFQAEILEWVGGDAAK